MWRIFQSAFCLGLLHFATVTQAAAEPSSTQIQSNPPRMIDRADTLKDKPLHHADWRAQSGPWADVLEDNYVSHLNQHQRNQYDQAFDNKDCAALRNLQTLAFFRKFPNFIAAHEKDWVAAAFERTVINTRPDLQLCENWLRAEKVLNFIRTKDPHLLPFDFSEGAAPSNRLKKTTNDNSTRTLIDRAVNSLCGNLSSIMHHATDRDARQAIRLIVRLSDQEQDVRFTPEQLYYVFLRAKQLNLLTRDETHHIDSLYHKVKAADRIKIETFLENPNGGAPTPDLRARFCEYPILSTRERLSLR